MRATDFVDPVARSAGSQFLFYESPRVALAKPRSTLGYTLTRASRVDHALCALTMRFAR
jgi:hypothetical protein